MATKELKIKTTAGLLETVKQMENLITSLKEGTICIRKNDEVIFLKPQEPLNMELKAITKPDKYSVREKVTIKLTWDKSSDLLVKNDTFAIYHPESETTQTPSHAEPFQKKEMVRTAALPHKKPAAKMGKPIRRRASRATKIKA